MNENQIVSQNGTPSSRQKGKRALSSMVISAMMLAISLIIKLLIMYIPMANWPHGGSISLVLIPLVLASLYCGPIWGGFVGVSYGLIDFFIDGVTGWSTNPIIILLAFVLDYLIAFGSCAIAGLFRKAFYEKKAWAPAVSVLCFGLIRFISHFFSGMLVWTSNADYENIIPDFSWGGFVYSMTYNGSYMLPTTVICMVVITLMLSALYTTFRLPIVSVQFEKYPVEHDIKRDLPPFQSMAIFLILGLAIFSILTIVPAVGMSGFAIIPLIFSLSIAIYEVLGIVKSLKATEPSSKLTLEIICLVLSLVVVALSLCGLLSQFTFAYDIYHPVE